MPYIVVDAGHGGWDKGAHFGAYNEKDITYVWQQKLVID